MTDFSVHLEGIAAAQRELSQLVAAAAKVANIHLKVGSPLIYAYGIETGRHVSGRLARRAGGAWYLTRAVQSVVRDPNTGSRLAGGVARGPEGARAELVATAYAIVARAQQLVPVDTGALKNSLQVVEAGQPARGGSRGGRTSAGRGARP